MLGASLQSYRTPGTPICPCSPPCPRCPWQVVRQLLRMLETSGRDAQPRSAEAQRVLSFFISSLKNPTLVGGKDAGAGRDCGARA